MYYFKIKFGAKLGSTFPNSQRLTEKRSPDLNISRWRRARLPSLQTFCNIFEIILAPVQQFLHWKILHINVLQEKVFSVVLLPIFPPILNRFQPRMVAAKSLHMFHVLQPQLMQMIGSQQWKTFLL